MQDDRGAPSEHPFSSIESAHEYLELLGEALAEASADVRVQLAEAARERATRREQALRLVAFNMTRLEESLATSRRRLNDLRSLRRLLLAERPARRARPPAGQAAPGEGREG